VAGLETVSTDLAAVVAVDMPQADSRLLRDLAARWSGEPAVVPRANGVLQPLHALYATAALDHLRAAVRAGQRSATRVVLDLGALVVDVDVDAFARNLNRPADLGAAEPNG
jgi:molybdopterin-guanine dinucleotide biosynthesis protein A